ncbi:MAG: TraX family protein [Bacillota bacterium]|nr:TraX family protein [Bacillota bacterium]
MYEENKMEEKKTKKKSFLLSRNVLKWMAYFFLFLYCYSRIVIQNGQMHIESINSSVLSEMMSQNTSFMALANKAVVFEFLGYLAIPMFAFLLADGYKYTSDFKKYFLRCLILALTCEPLYDFATHGSWISFTSQNPVFSLCIALLLLKGLDTIQAKKWMYPILLVAAILWAILLKTSFGLGIVLLSGVYWIFRNKRYLQLLAGCAISSIFYTAPLASLLLCLSKGKEENFNGSFFYAIYPLILIVCIIL